MKERHNRLSVIRDIIKENRIDSQDALLQKLKEEGYGS